MAPKELLTSSDSYEKTVKVFAFRLRELRQKAGLTQAELGSKSGSKQSYIFELETGGANVTLKTLVKMAEVLNVSARDLLPEGTSAPPSATSIELLRSLFERVAVLLSDYEAQSSRREQHHLQLLTELRSFTDLAAFLPSIVHGGRSPSANPDTADAAARTSEHI